MGTARPISTTAISGGASTSTSTIMDLFPGGAPFREGGGKELGIWTKHLGVLADWLQQELKGEAVTCGPLSVAVCTAGRSPVR